VCINVDFVRGWLHDTRDHDKVLALCSHVVAVAQAARERRSHRMCLTGESREMQMMAARIRDEMCILSALQVQ